MIGKLVMATGWCCKAFQNHSSTSNLCELSEGMAQVRKLACMRAHTHAHTHTRTHAHTHTHTHAHTHTYTHTHTRTHYQRTGQSTEQNHTHAHTCTQHLHARVALAAMGCCASTATTAQKIQHLEEEPTSGAKRKPTDS